MTTEFSVDKVVEGTYVAVVGRQVGTDYYVARLRMQADGQVRLYVLRNSSAIATSYLVPNLTVVPGQEYKVELQVTGTTPTTVAVKVWKSTDTEPAAWQRSVTDNVVAALQAKGRVGVYGYLPSTATNGPVNLSFSSITVTDPSIG